MMVLKIAWRNIWRNPWRSAIVLLAITFGLWGSNLISALANGMVLGQIGTAINSEVAHITLQEKNYPLQEELKYNFEQDQVEEKLDQLPEDVEYSHRVVVAGMLSSAGSIQGLTFLGINPETEKSVVDIHQHIVKGNYFDSLTSASPILISQKTADDLKVKLNSKLVANFPDVNNEVVYGLFRVIGIYKTNNQPYDEQNAFVLHHDLSAMLHLDSNLVQSTLVKHVNTDDLDVRSLKQKVEELLPGYSVQSWEDLKPELVISRDMMAKYMYIVLIIVLVALVFVIVNSMLMVILERTKEIGTLRALGMNKTKVVLMIFYETVIQSMLGGVLGTLFSYIVVQYFQMNGLQFDSVSKGLEAYGYPSVFYPYLPLESYIVSIVLVFITALLSSIPPVRRALKLNPSTAIRSL